LSHDLIPRGSIGSLSLGNIVTTMDIYLNDDTQFEDVDGIQIHSECLSQDFDDIAWEPELDDTPEVDPNDDMFGYYK
jgi:hypothetical protein